MKRDELTRELRRTVIGCTANQNDDCSSCHCGDDQVQRILELIDLYTDGILKDLRQPAQDLWPAERVAKHVGLRDANNARMWLSRHKIRRADTAPHPQTGRPVSLYPADQVRAAKAAKKASR